MIGARVTNLKHVFCISDVVNSYIELSNFIIIIKICFMEYLEL